MNRPLISVIIRTFNREKLLSKAIKSVLDQSYPNFELIILDNLSTDSTEKLVRELIETDNRISYVKYNQKYTPGSSLNLGNSIAKGKYLTYLDDDDQWKSDKLEKQLKKFEPEDDKLGLVTGGVQYWNMEKEKKTKIRQWIPSLKGEIYYKSLGQSGNIFGPPSVVMISRKAINKIGKFREDMPRGACQQYFRRIAKEFKIDYVPEVLLDYYFHKNTITAINSKKDLIKSISSLKIKINSTKNDLELVPDLYLGELLKLAHYYFISDDIKNSFKYYSIAKKYSSSFICIIIMLLILNLKPKRKIFYSIFYKSLRFIIKLKLKINLP
jgi:glycosyltransferase involved in cell wall biosynthesis